MAAPKYHFGSFVIFRGQRYQMLGLKTYIRKDGVPTYLVRWQSGCAECGKPFDCFRSIGTFNFNRRCQIHKKPGIRVR